MLNFLFGLDNRSFFSENQLIERKILLTVGAANKIFPSNGLKNILACCVSEEPPSSLLERFLEESKEFFAESPRTFFDGESIDAINKLLKLTYDQSLRSPGQSGMNILMIQWKNGRADKPALSRQIVDLLLPLVKKDNIPSVQGQNNNPNP